MDQRTVFFVGATGYIGGSILTGYLLRYPNFTYTALVRNPKDVPALEALGMKVVLGSTSDVELIEKAAAEHDIVVNCANADDLALTSAIVKGMLARAREGAAKWKPLLIHTSGTGVVMFGDEGSFRPGKDEKIYDDNVVEDIKSIPPQQPHRNVDLTIFAAGELGLIDTYIIAPSTIYGKGRGPVRNISDQVNNLIRTAVQRKEVVQVGSGTNIWNHVHVDDLIELYGLVFDLALSGAGFDAPHENFFWGSAGVHAWGDVTKELARLMHAKGLVVSDKPKSVSLSEAPHLVSTASTSRTVANRGFALGWKPSGKSLMETLPEEIELTISQM